MKRTLKTIFTKGNEKKSPVRLRRTDFRRKKSAVISEICGNYFQVKRIFLIPLLAGTFSLHAQNGFSDLGSPLGYTNTQLAFKNAIALDNSGNVWVAYQRIGLGKYDGSNWTVFNTQNSSLPSDTVNALAVDAGNNLWLGTYKGLAKFDGTNWTIYNTSNSSLPNNNVIAVAVNGSDVWTGTRSGAAKFNGSSWTVYNTSNSGIAGDTVQCFAFMTGGLNFIGTSRGFSLLSGSNWTNFNTSNSGLLSNNIFCLFPYQGNLWLGTIGGGLHKYYGGTIVNMDNLYIPCWNTSASTGNIFSITQGPGGGVIFSSNIPLTFPRPMTEILLPIGKARYYKNNFVGTKTFLAYNSSNGLLYFINDGGPYKDLYSFNVNLYNGLSYGYYTDFMNCLDINEVSALILNRGDMHWDGCISPACAHYEVPKGSGINSVFTSALWLGGIDQGGQLHVAGMTYRQTGVDFWPGPLDTTNATCDSLTSYQYDRIWKINRYKVEEFQYYFANGSVQNGTYIPDYDIISWPAHGDLNKNQAQYLAPFVDVNNNGIYNPMQEGDYPLIKGDQELFCIFNDNLVPPGTHTETGGLPFGVEIHLSAYSYTCPTIADSLKTLNYTTLYHYTLYNRSVNQYDSVHIGYWQDADLGCYTDDYVGCLKNENAGFTYNGDSIDDPPCGPPGYGASPPILSSVVLNGAPANPGDGIDNNNNGTIDEPGEINLMTSFLYYGNIQNVPWGNPVGPQHFYNYLKGVWGDSTSMIDCNGDTTRFSYEGLPYDPNSCAETNVGNMPGDRRFILGSGPFTFYPGQKAEFDFAIVWSRDTTLTYLTQAYFDNSRNDNQKVRQWFLQNNFPSCLLLNVGTDENISEQKPIFIFPNPSSDFITVFYKPQTKSPSFEIIDILGKTISNFKFQISNSEYKFNISNLPQGVYLLKIKDGEMNLTGKFVKK